MERCAGMDPRRRARFRREALVGARLRHRNVVSILEVGELPDGSPYLVMEHIEGVELASILAQGTLSPPAVVELGVQLLAAAAALWEGGVVHRDIKPQNVMVHRTVDEAVEVKLLDFGIVKALRTEPAPGLTLEGFVLGTPHYMAPEQVRGEPLDVRSDLFAISTVLYEALAGAPPLEGACSDAVLTKVLSDEPVPLSTRRPDCPPQIANIVMRGLAKDRDARWTTPAEMSLALARAARELGFLRGAAAW